MEAVENFIPQMEPWFDDKEADAVFAYMKSGGWVTEFEKTREFEQLIADSTGAKYCSVVNNGTVSLLLALLAYGVGPGDEVVVPDFTMVATANVVKLIGAYVVFADIEADTLCLDFASLKSVVTPKTKAIMLVSINGRYPRSVERIITYCREKKIIVIEDAAQSFGSFYHGQHVGTLGDIGSFSFATPKIISTGQGGALITNDGRIMERISRLRDFGRVSSGVDTYEMMGWNFKFTDLQAVIGIEQMEKLSWRVERKKEIFALYQRLLADVSCVSFIPTDLENTVPSYMDIVVENKREELMEFLRRCHIGSRRFFSALHAEPFYHRSERFLVAERMAAQALLLPSSSKLTDEEITRVCGVVRQFYG